MNNAPTQGSRPRSVISQVVQALVTGAGSAAAGLLALTVAVCWTIVGVVQGFPEHWTAILVSATALVTFAMVFLIQHTTDRQLRAVLLKLDELIRVEPAADDSVIGAERRPLHVQEHLEGKTQEP